MRHVPVEQTAQLGGGGVPILKDQDDGVAREHGLPAGAMVAAQAAVLRIGVVPGMARFAETPQMNRKARGAWAGRAEARGVGGQSTRRHCRSESSGYDLGVVEVAARDGPLWAEVDLPPQQRSDVPARPAWHTTHAKGATMPRVMWPQKAGCRGRRWTDQLSTSGVPPSRESVRGRKVAEPSHDMTSRAGAWQRKGKRWAAVGSDMRRAGADAGGAHTAEFGMIATLLAT